MIHTSVLIPQRNSSDEIAAQLPRGMYCFLATFVAMRGYRIGEIYVETSRRSRPLRDAWPNPGDLLCAWWLKRRWRKFLSQELIVDERSQPNLSIAQIETTDQANPDQAHPEQSSNDGLTPTGERRSA